VVSLPKGISLQTLPSFQSRIKDEFGEIVKLEESALLFSNRTFLESEHRHKYKIQEDLIRYKLKVECSRDLEFSRIIYPT